MFLYLKQFSGDFRHVGEIFPGIVPASKFCLVGVARFAGSPENGKGKGPGFDSRRGAPVQHSLLDIDDEEDANAEGDRQENAEEDKDDEDGNEA